MAIGKMVGRALRQAKGGAKPAPKKRGGMAGMVGRAQAQVKARTAKPSPGRATTQPVRGRPSRAMPGQGKAPVRMSKPGVGTPRAKARPINQGGNPRAKKPTVGRGRPSRAMPGATTSPVRRTTGGAGKPARPASKPQVRRMPAKPAGRSRPARPARGGRRPTGRGPARRR